MNEGERHRETELTNSHDGYGMRGGDGGEGGEVGSENRSTSRKKGPEDWKLKFMTLKMTMTETEPGPSLLSPLWWHSTLQ